MMSLLPVANMKLQLFLTMMMTFAHVQSQQSDLNIITVVSVPKAGREGPTERWERGLEILPGAHLAVKHINDANILGNYSLNLIETITEGCDVNTALVEFIGHVTQPHATEHSGNCGTSLQWSYTRYLLLFPSQSTNNSISSKSHLQVHWCFRTLASILTCIVCSPHQTYTLRQCLD